MTAKALITLVEHVATLRTDMDWIKKGMYICTAASVSAFLAVVGEIAIKVLIK